MNIVFLGTGTEDKRFLILCLAKIMSVFKKVSIYSDKKYGFDDDETPVYDYMGLEIKSLLSEEINISVLDQDTCNLFDIDELISLPFDFTAVAVCEPSRRYLEQSVNLISKFLLEAPALEIMIIYLNLMEYCRVGQKYLDTFRERSLPGYTKESEVLPVYFEEKNKAAMLECQFSGMLAIKALSPSFKGALMKLIQSLFSLESKAVKKLLKKAERMK